MFDPPVTVTANLMALSHDFFSSFRIGFQGSGGGKESRLHFVLLEGSKDSPDGHTGFVFTKGLRNPYGLALDKSGNIFATDNGPDAPAAPNELNYIVKGGDYGFPNYFGVPPAGSGTLGPVTIRKEPSHESHLDDPRSRSKS